MDTLIDMLPFLIPVFILQLTLLVIALVDLVKRQYVIGGNKIIWLLVIILVNIIGPIVYLLAGRRDTPDGSYSD